MISSLATVEDEFTADAIKSELGAAQKERAGLIVEGERLSGELEQKELTQEDEERLRALAAQLKQKIDNATFEQKRYILDKLDVKVQLRRDDVRRFLDCSCAVQLGVEVIELDSRQAPSRGRRPGYCTRR